MCARVRLPKNLKHDMLWQLSGKSASQSFSALRRRNQVKICEKSGHVPGFSHFDRASVRLWRARSPMQFFPRSMPRVDRKRVKKTFLTRSPGRMCARVLNWLICTSAWLGLVVFCGVNGSDQDSTDCAALVVKVNGGISIQDIGFHK